MNNEERIVRLSDALAMAADARHMATSPVWDEAWEAVQRTFLQRLKACGPTEDVERYRLQVALEVADLVRVFIENKGNSVESLQKDLALLEGRKQYAVA